MSEFTLAPGVLIGGRYRLETHLGDGGMGTVWSATHTVTRRSVAMKFLKESLKEKPDLRRRFLREASAASRLEHPNVVEVLDVFDVEDRSPVLVMERLNGETLAQKLVRDERLSVEETVDLLLPVISAVGCAHAAGVVHRDLKPDNIFLAKLDNGVCVKVLDFGIAKLAMEQHAEADTRLVTGAGLMLGTPCYMSPEQASGEADVDHRSDIWSLGIMLYECLSGTRPIEGENLAQVVTRLVSDGIMPLERLTPELPRDVTKLVMQMLSREKSKRPQDLLEVAGVLERYARFAAPAFGVPSSQIEVARSSQSVPAGSRAGVSEEEPISSTLHSSTPFEGSKTITLRKARQRWRIPALVCSAIGISVVLFLIANSAVDSESESQSASASSSGAISSSKAAESTPVQLAPSAASAVATPTPAMAPKTLTAPASSASDEATLKITPRARELTPGAPETRRKHSLSPTRENIPATPPPRDKPSRSAEDTLFSGRK